VTEQEYRELEPLYDQAKAEIPTWPHINITRVQRKYTLGYNRAARLLENLAEYGALTYNKHDGTYRRADTSSEPTTDR